VSKRHRDKSRLGPFVPLLKETLESAAWRSMSPAARVLYIALKGRYGIILRNNGRIFLSVRESAEETGLNKDPIARAFRELTHYGFIVQTKGAALGVDGKGKAPHWRLTELGYDRSTDQGFPALERHQISKTKKQNPVRKFRTHCPKISDTSV
jgi:DNA-binding transcriptional regulator YhcF (GntR family)